MKTASIKRKSCDCHQNNDLRLFCLLSLLRMMAISLVFILYYFCSFHCILHFKLSSRSSRQSRTLLTMPASVRFSAGRCSTTRSSTSGWQSWQQRWRRCSQCSTALSVSNCQRHLSSYVCGIEILYQFYHMYVEKEMPFAFFVIVRMWLTCSRFGFISISSIAQ